MTTLERLKVLEADAEAGCVAAGAIREKIEGAINWADLHCVEAGHCRTSDETEYFYVLIDECAPNQADLYGFLRNHLKDAGWDNVDIRFEW